MTHPAVTSGGLAVARELHDFATQRALPGSGVEPKTFWAGLETLLGELAPTNAALLARRDQLQAQLDAQYRAKKAVDESYLREIGYLLPEPAAFQVTHRERGPRDRQHRRAAAGGAGDERALRAQRGQRALGQPVRRALRHRRDRRGRRRDRGGTYNPVRGAKVIAFARSVLDRPRRWRRAATPRRRRTRSRTASSPSPGGRQRDRARRAGEARRLPRRAGRAVGRCCSATTGCTSRSSSTALTPSARPTRPASPTWCSSRPSPPSWTSRTASRRSTPPTRSRSTATGSA